MRLSTVVRFIGVGPALLLSQGFSGVEASSRNFPERPIMPGVLQGSRCEKRDPTLRSSTSCSQHLFGGQLTTANYRRLEEDAPGVNGHVLMGNGSDNEIFVATNATNFPQGITNGTIGVTISDTEECNSDAYGRALEFQFEVPVTYEINEFGMIESESGWFQQPIRELQGNSTLPVSLAALISGVAAVEELEYGLAVYLSSSDAELLGCASLKKLDEDKAAEYDELFNDLSQGKEAVKVKEAPSSGSKISLLVSAIVVVGVTAMLGDMFAL